MDPRGLLYGLRQADHVDRRIGLPGSFQCVVVASFAEGIDACGDDDDRLARVTGRVRPVTLINAS
jgi:hypothetical protein